MSIFEPIINTFDYEDSLNHISAMISWNHPRGTGYFFSQIVIVSDTEVYAFLADLRTSPRPVTVCNDFPNAVDTLYGNLKGVVVMPPPNIVKWFYREGRFNSHDAWDHERLINIGLIFDDEGNCTDGSTKEVLTAEEESEVLKITNVGNVEVEIEKLPDFHGKSKILNNW